MLKKCAVFTVADSRDDYYAQRQHMVAEQLESIRWLTEVADCFFTPVLRCEADVKKAVAEAAKFDPQSVIIHIPIWADPVFAESIALTMDQPILLLGNRDPATSSMVGLLGAGGALDQIGRKHTRVLMRQVSDQDTVKAFINSTAAVSALRGSKMLRFGDCALGIRTAAPDAMLWQRDFGVSVQSVDESSIVTEAEKIDAAEVQKYRQWLDSALGSITFGDLFTEEVLDRQIRSYLAAKKLIDAYQADFAGIKCQPELSDHYANQCLSHILLNATCDASGEKAFCPCACESDANGALTMHILGLLSGAPASLMDVRSIDEENGYWLLANCGAMPMDHYDGQNGRHDVRMQRHTFGKSGAASCTGELRPGRVTMARLCTKNGAHWMAVVRGESIPMSEETRKKSPLQFPTAYIKTEPLDDFLTQYDSNHIHIVFGDVSQSLQMFCDQVGITCKVW